MILCCGEALIDFVPLGGDVSGYQPCPGGSPYNVAVGLGRLQVPVAYFAKISTDFFGDRLVSYLEENGVNTEWILRAAGPTTLAFVSLPDKTGMIEGQREPQFLIYSNDAVDRSLTMQELPARLPAWVRAVHFGSISLVMEPSAASLETLMRRESGRRILSVDPNVRPGVISDREAYRRRFEEWVRLVDIVRLSVVDLEWLYPSAEPEAVARAWLSWGGAGLVIITKGADGATAYAAGGATAQAAAPVVEVADTVGAGDSFFAALLAYLYTKGALYNRAQIQNLSQDILSACLEFACAAAAINCSRPGASPPYRRELDL